MRIWRRQGTRAAVLLMIICLELYHWMDVGNSHFPKPILLNPDAEPTITIPMSQVMTGEVQLKQDDERMIKYILDTGLLEPPSKLAYNLTHPSGDYGGPHGIQPPMTVIRNVLRELNMTGGDRFFVECGAYDGEMLSNTLYLERQFGWKGLLVEGNPYNYEQMKSKNRKAWLSKTCLSIHPYPHRARFLASHALSPWGKVLEPGNPKFQHEVEVQCVPLFTLLSALKVTTVDHFTLDVEGNELEVLKTIPFDKVFIKTLTVEYAHSPTKNQILKFMKDKGYVEIGRNKFPDNWQHNDYLFVHQNVTLKPNVSKL